MTVLTDHHGLRSENFVGKINYYEFLVLFVVPLSYLYFIYLFIFWSLG